MKITDDKSLFELQEEFNAEFPFLQLQFFSHPFSNSKRTDEKYRLNPNLMIGQVRQTHNCGYIQLDPGLATHALELTFKNIFGLNVQIFRKSFGNWIPAWSTETWTLKEQNLRSMLTEDKAVIV
jgi:hypothetical protein